MENKTALLLSAALSDLSMAAKQLVEETAKVVGEQDHVALIKHLVQVRNVEAMMKDAKDSIEKLENLISRVYIPDEFRRVGIKTINVDNIGRVTVSYRWGCSMPDKEMGLKWLRETGNEGIIIETVNAGTLAAFAKNEVETKGKELPQEIFKVSLSPFTSITKV